MSFTTIEAKKIISKFKGFLHLNLVPFKPSTFCTQYFESWWQEHYVPNIFGVTDLNNHITKVFSSMQDKGKKCMHRHIKEIREFQKYFETVYNPTDLGRTIRDASLILKEKFTTKLPCLSIP